MPFWSSLFPPSVTAQEAHDAAERGVLTLLDVREQNEWRTGHAPGSKNIPLSVLRARLHELSTERTYVAVCRSGMRSRRAVGVMREAGFDVMNLRGGMTAWRGFGLPLEPRNGRVM